MSTAVVAGHDPREYGGSALGGGTKPDSGPDQEDFQQLVMRCNKDGMDFLRKGQYKQAFEQLKYAEAILVANTQEDEPTSLLAVTCNNLGCYYKKVGKLHAALSYLRKALKIEVSLQTDDVTVAGTHLNICAILSKLDKHDKAVQHALCALELISNRVASATDAVSQDEYSVLAIAYHNVAVERDYLHQWDQAAMAYQQGHQIAKKCLGEQHPLTQTLCKNCDAAMQKSQSLVRDQAKPSTTRRGGRPPTAPSEGAKTTPASAAGGGGNGGEAQLLPDIGSTSRTKTQPNVEDALPIPANSVHQEAADWVQSEETLAWRPPQGASIQNLGGQAGQSVGQQFAPAGRAVYSPRSMGNNVYAPLEQPADPFGVGGVDSGAQHGYPTFLDTIAQEVPPPLGPPAAPLAAPASPPPLIMMPREKQVQAKEEKERYCRPQDIPDDAATGRRTQMVGADGRGNATLGAGARSPQGTAEQRRAARIAARNKKALGNTADRIDAGGKQKEQSLMLRRTAAERIQRKWRESHQSKVESRKQIEKENAAATKIQARWRAYHVRRSKMEKAAIVIQRWVRGFLVRLVMRRHNAAVVIQRHVMGMMVRKNLAQFNSAATALQKAMRGNRSRKSVEQYKRNRFAATFIIQNAARRWKARRIAQQKRELRDAQEARDLAAVALQSAFRGLQGRERATVKQLERAKELSEHRAVTKVQSWVRRDLAIKRVEMLRQMRLARMNRAATTIRKYWLRKLYRTRFRELRSEFRMHLPSVVTIQRYVRGFLVRLRMWRDAIRAEEELWAAVEIQRVWRGYMGRLRWELAYEAVFSREVAASRLQRYCRGWLARTRVHRLRRKNARAEFEKARRRFKAAQKIQARVRGIHARKKVLRYRAYVVHVVLTVQRVWRGFYLRRQLWHEAQDKRATQIQAVVRGFITRHRRISVIARIIFIQRMYRAWLRLPEESRRQREHWRRKRKEAALADEMEPLPM